MRYEMQRFRNECSFLLTQIESMRRQNSKDKFPKIIKEYLIESDKKLTDIEIVMAQVIEMQNIVHWYLKDINRATCV